MGYQSGNADYDFMVSGIEFVVCRSPEVQWRIDNISNDKSYIIGLPMDGSAIYTFDGMEKKVEKNDLLFFKKNQTHSARADSRWAYYSTGFDLVIRSADAENDIQKLPAITRIQRFAEYEDLFQKLCQAWNAKTVGYMLKCRSLITELLYLLVMETQAKGSLSPHGETIEGIKYFLIENSRKTFQIKELADMAGMSPSYFSLLFKNHTGQTVTQYQSRLKINKACDILLSGACNISEAAYNTGFSDVYYFSRLFKKITGFTPSSYAKRK